MIKFIYNVSSMKHQNKMLFTKTCTMKMIRSFNVKQYVDRINQRNHLLRNYKVKVWYETFFLIGIFISSWCSIKVVDKFLLTHMIFATQIFIRIRAVDNHLQQKALKTYAVGLILSLPSDSNSPIRRCQWQSNIIELTKHAPSWAKGYEQ